MVGISNARSVSGDRATMECDGEASLVVAVGDFHTAESLPDSVASKRQRGGARQDARPILSVVV